MRKKQPLCFLDDAGLFIGLTSVPPGTEERFCSDTIEELFASYRRSREHLLRKRNTREFDGFYQPRCYYMFGNFDIAVLSLFDGFDFGTKHFNPANPNFDTSHERVSSFSHHVIMGPTPKFTKGQSLVATAQKTFLGDRRLPLFALCQIKISNALAASHGVRGLRSLLIAINHLLTEEKRQFAKTSIDYAFILLESFSWHEVTLLIFTSAYAPIFEVIPMIRELTIEDVEQRVGQALPEIEQRELRSERFLPLRLVRNQTTNFGSNNFPAVLSTTTLLGFDLALFDSESQLHGRISEGDTVTPLSRWFTRGGHLDQLVDTLAPRARNVRICYGRGDLVSAPGTTNTKEYINKTVELLKREEIGTHSLSVHTIHMDSKDWSDRQRRLNNIDFSFLRQYSDCIGSLAIPKDQVECADQMLKEMNIPLILRNAVSNILAGFNQGVADAMLYTSFLELRPILQQLQDTIKANYRLYEDEDPGTREKLRAFPNILAKLCGSFQTAAANRLQARHLSGELADFTLFYRGGVQQLLTACDGLIKSAAAIMERKSTLFAFIGEYPTIKTFQWALRLNYLHLFRPERLATTIIHEVSTYYIANESRGSQGGEDVERILEAVKEYSIRYSSARGGRAAGIQSEFLHFLTGAVLDDAYADAFSLSLGFLNQVDLFSEWSWYEFEQATENRTQPKNRFPRENVMTFLLRQLIAARMLDEKLFYRYLMPEKLDSWSFDCGKLCELGKIFVNELFNLDSVTEWAGTRREKIGMQCRLVFGRPPEAYRISIAPVVLSTMSNYRKGISPEFPVDSPTGKYGHYRYCQILILAYLKLLGELSADSGGSLERAREQRPALRRAHLQYRCILWMGLWDLAVKTKFDYIIRETGAIAS